MSRMGQSLLAVLGGACVGAVIGVVTISTLSWYHGGSSDPRCAADIKGYVEVHQLDYEPARISCVYEPRVDAPCTGSVCVR